MLEWRSDKAFHVFVHPEALLPGAAQDFGLAAGLENRIQPGDHGAVESFPAGAVSPADTVLDLLEKSGGDILGWWGVIRADFGPGNLEPPKRLDELQLLVFALESLLPVMLHQIQGNGFDPGHSMYCYHFLTFNPE
jgi:hypothetical protein